MGGGGSRQGPRAHVRGQGGTSSTLLSSLGPRAPSPPSTCGWLWRAGCRALCRVLKGCPSHLSVALAGMAPAQGGLAEPLAPSQTCLWVLTHLEQAGIVGVPECLLLKAQEAKGLDDSGAAPMVTWTGGVALPFPGHHPIS